MIRKSLWAAFIAGCLLFCLVIGTACGAAISLTILWLGH